MWPFVLQLALSQLPAADAFAARADIQHWELDTDLASAVGGDALRVENGEAKLVEQTLPDGQARALEVPAAARVRVPTDVIPDRPGFVDEFTVVLDLKVEDSGWVRAPILQMDGDDDDDAEADLALDKRGKRAVFGVRGARGGTLVPGEWHRLAVVVDGKAGAVTYYVDGVRAAAVKRTIADSRWSLEPELVLFSDDEDLRGQPTVWLAALQVRGAALSASDVSALGVARAAGIPRVEPGAFVFRDVSAARAEQGQLVTVRWDAALPAGDVTLALAKDDEVQVLGKVPMAGGSASFRVPLALSPLGWIVRAQGLPRGHVDGPRLSVGQPAIFELERELVGNGDFERGLDGWTVTGSAVLGKGATGQGVVGGAGDYLVSQRIALPQPARERGLVVEAFARMTRREAKGRFDDRGELFVRFIGADDADLGRVRALGTDASQWSPYTLRGLAPPGTVALEVGVQAWHRRGAELEVGVDDVSVRLVSDTTPSVLRLSKRPIVSPNDAPDHLTLLFETDRTDAWPEVVWGPADQSTIMATGPTTRTTLSPRHQVHEVVIGPLVPGKEYRYSVRVGPWVSPTWSVRGPADPGSVGVQRIAWLADNQHGWQTFREMLPRIAQAKPDFAVLAGDIVQNGHMLREWQTEWFASLSVADFAQTTPIWFARGNHDGEHALAYAYTNLPGNESWFAFTTAGARIIVLNSEAEHGVVPEQLAWLKAELASPASKAADFRIVTFHKAPFSNRWSSAKSTYDGEDWVRRFWVPVFSDLDVDLVVAGHAHAYMRMDLDGVRYVVVGGAGGHLDTYKTAKWPMDKDIPTHHWALMELGEGRIKWTVEDADGKVIDTMTMRSRTKKAANR